MRELPLRLPLRKLNRLFVDNKIDRRTFIGRLTKFGVSAAAATAMADSFAVQSTDNVSTSRNKSFNPDSLEPDSPEPGRTVENMTGGDLTIEFMQDWGVKYLFGLAGSEEVGLLDALVDRDIPFVTCLHESAAMAMADGYARSTGETPVVSLHSVAGAAYALGQMVGSFRDRIPVVVCAGRQSTDYRGQDGFLEAANLHTLPEHYTQWTWDVMSAETIPEVMRRATMFAEAPPGGPTFVTFSDDLWAQKVSKAEILPKSRSRVNNDIPPPASHVEKIVKYLLQAERPVLFLGNETTRFNISDNVAAIAEQTGALVMLANKAPLSFPTTHPNFAGQFHRDDPDLSSTIDCFWSLGAHMFKHGSKPEIPLLSPTARVMHTSLASDDLGRNHPVDTSAIASIETTSKAVLDELGKHDLNTNLINKRKKFVAEYGQKRRLGFEKKRQKEWDDNPVSVSRLVVEIDRAMSSDACVVSEVVTSDDHLRKYLRFDHSLPAGKRRRSYDTTSGILGWGLAAAIGVKIGNPKNEVWCLSGDGCYNFGCQALWSAARYEVPLGVVVFNNGEYQANRLNDVIKGGKRMTETGNFIGVNIGHPDISYVKQAGAYGIEGERVTEPSDIAAALQRCKESMAVGKPYVVDVKIAKRFAGKDSDYYDFFSVAELQNG